MNIEHDRFVTLVANRADGASEKPVDVVGMSCGFDVLRTNVALPRPATVLVCEDAAEVVKRAETVDDVFRRDVVPARLEGDG